MLPPGLLAIASILFSAFIFAHRGSSLAAQVVSLMILLAGCALATETLQLFLLSWRARRAGWNATLFEMLFSLWRYRRIRFYQILPSKCETQVTPLWQEGDSDIRNLLAAIELMPRVDRRWDKRHQDRSNLRTL